MAEKPPKDPDSEKKADFDVFVSYAGQDSDVAKRLVESLEHRGMRCWVAPEQLKPGEEWAHQIREAIDSSRSFMVVVSGSTVPSSRWVSTEWSAIQNSSWHRHDVVVFPVTVGNVDVPPFLRQWHTFRLDSPAAAVDGITESVSAHLTRGVGRARDEKVVDREITAERFREIERALETGRTEDEGSSSDG